MINKSSDIKNFIIKLNDRNIQRKRESGITSYVLSSVLIVCIYKLFSNSEKLLTSTQYFPENLKNSIWLICYLFNLLLLLGGLVYTLFPTFENFKNVKLIKASRTEPYVFLSLILAFPFSLALTIYTLITNESDSTIFKIYCYLLIFFGLIGLIMTYVLFTKNKNPEFKIKSTPQPSEKIIYIILYLFIFIICTYSTYLIYTLTVECKVEIIKLIILAYLTYVIIERILQVNTFDKHFSQMEDFEYEIVLRGLEEDQIRKEFQERFSGFLISDWIGHQTSIFLNRIKTYKEDIDFNSNLLFNLELEFQNNWDNPKYGTTKKFYENRIKAITVLFNDQNQNQIKILKDTINLNFLDIESSERSRTYNLISDITNYEFSDNN